MSFWFHAATLVGAVLTFTLELFVAKMLLPLFGGTPSVWNTCVLFFQAMLLAGYGYAHLMGSSARWRMLAVVHLGVLAVPLTVLPLPIGTEWAPRSDVSPVVWQIWVLLATSGLPFFAVTATTPLIQRWLAGCGQPAGRDPYSLYASSNFGSLLALLGYPLVVEPSLDLPATSRFWTAGYVLLLVLLGGCAFQVLRRGNRNTVEAPAADADRPRSSVGRLRWRWLALAFVPSSLMLSVTTHLSTNVASAPLLWVLPLALYLVTYILAFARRRLFPLAMLERGLPLMVLLLAIVLMSEGMEPPPWLLFLLHLGGLFAMALVCHGQLADLRPPVTHLTEYYFWMALGGLAGGIFNALLAPALFNGIVEYPLVLVVACLLRRPTTAGGTGLPTTKKELLQKDLLPALGLGLLVVVIRSVVSKSSLGGGPAALGLTLGLPVLVCYLFLLRPIRFALALGALFLASEGGLPSARDEVFASRTYYGLHRVRRDGPWTRLYHGPTLHGIQDSRPEKRREPLAYYHRSGPVGSLFDVLEAKRELPRRVGVVGAGVGSLAAYSRAGQDWTFFELDPTVVFLAKDSGHFGFWNDSAVRPRVVLGDARLSLALETSAQFDLLVLDAFSSDAVPAHLLTREALHLYQQRLAPDGVLAFHISNRFLDLEAVVDGLARDASLMAVSRADLVLSVEEREAGKLPSHWVVLSANASLIEALRFSGGWQSLTRRENAILWTDRFSNLFGVLRWSG